MAIAHPTPTLDERSSKFLETLNCLDFGPLAYKLMNPEDGLGISLDQAIDAIIKYKGFLFLCHQCRGTPLSPSRYVDFAWHNHILDTELYFIQTTMLYGHYLHHFPFFGKRSAADESTLREAADHTKNQAKRYFGWNDDDWCGTVPKHKGPRAEASLIDLIGAIFPARSAMGVHSDPDIVTIQAGRFRHTIEYRGPHSEGWFDWASRFREVSEILKLPIWVISCMPVELDILNQVSIIRDRDRLTEIAQRLVDQRLTPDGFSADRVTLRIAV